MFDANLDSKSLFYELLHAESEAEVTQVLSRLNLLDESLWLPLGGIDNNFAAANNQQSDPAAALVEKIVNSIDAVLMAQAFQAAVDPEGPDAPATMTEAVERLFGVRTGKLEYLDPQQRTKLAENIQVVAVGSKKNPNYLIVDKGEGQTPQRFPDTFLSIMRSNKMKIPFVQGKFNSGGLGVLPFCGEENYQLICSKRHPDAPVSIGDSTSHAWGFTLIRRLDPAQGRRSSMYVYLAPGGVVPQFSDDAVCVLPTETGSQSAPISYSAPLPFGTCIKLFNYQWNKRTVITLDARREFQSLLIEPALPFRLHESRSGYRANTLSSTVAGAMLPTEEEQAASDRSRLEPSFPSFGSFIIGGIGELRYRVYVFNQAVESRDVPNGVLFLINGQVHGRLPSNFVSQGLRLSYLSKDHGPMLVTIDCTNMSGRAREDFFMASRDRVRRNNVYQQIIEVIREELKAHPGLQLVNQQRRQAEIRKPLELAAERDELQALIDADETFKSLFALGDNLVATTGPGQRPPYVGRKFPTFFRVSREPNGGLIRDVPLNGFGFVEFDTDAENEYFDRADTPGELWVSRPELVKRSRLLDGKFRLGFEVPWNSSVGEQFEILVRVSDLEREARGGPFECRFKLQAAVERPEPESRQGRPNPPRDPNGRGGSAALALALPNIVDITRSEWGDRFTETKILEVNHSGDGGFDFVFNVDNAYLLTELRRTPEELQASVVRTQRYGTVFGALALLRHWKADIESSDSDIDLELVEDACNGIGRVVVPIARSLAVMPEEG